MAVNKPLEYVTFSADGLSDFKSVILPDIYEQLFLLDNFSERNISAIGVLADRQPVGALIGQITGEVDAVIHSLYVDGAYRRRGIGTELLDRFLSVLNMELDPARGKGDNVVPVIVSAEYSLPVGMADAFRGFLDSAGFGIYDEMPDVYYFESEQLKPFGKKEEGVFSFAGIEGTDEKELSAYFDSLGIVPALKYSFYSGKADDPEAMLLVGAGDDDTYDFYSVGLAESIGEEAFKKLVSSAVAAIKEDNGDFAVIVNGRNNILPGFWKALADEYGETIRHTQARLAAVFE